MERVALWLQLRSLIQLHSLFICCATGLEKKGHRVTLVVNTVHLNLVLSLLRSNSSVEFVGLKGDPEALQVRIVTFSSQAGT